MAGALVTAVVGQLALIIRERLQREVSLVSDVEKQLLKLKSNFEAIQGVLEDAEMKQVEDRSVRDWLCKLKDAAYDIDDLLDLWNTLFQQHQLDPFLVHHHKKVCSFIPFSCNSVGGLVLRRDIAIRVKHLNEKLDNIATEKARYQFSSRRPNAATYDRQTVAHVDLPMVKGRDIDKKTILTQLLCEEEGTYLPVVAIVGAGGIGKTTLAQLCCAEKDVKYHFEKVVWVCCEPFDKVMIAKSIVEGFTGKVPNANTLNVLLNRIHELARREKFLLVLDDMWPIDVEKWEALRASFLSCVRGSKVLVTTRSTNVAQQMQASYEHLLSVLSLEESWSLFSYIALSGKKENECARLEEIGREIVKKCKGLPLAVKSIGCLLRLKHRAEDWKLIMESEVWKSKVVKEILCPPLLLSYQDLPCEVKQCFLYCAVLQKDAIIDRRELIQLWMAQGYLGTEDDMERRGWEYFEELASHSFFQDFEKDRENNIVRCKMHDMVHDFVLFLAKDEFLTVETGAGEVEELVVKSASTSCKARHLTLKIANREDKTIAMPSIKDGGTLRTVFVGHGLSGSQSENDISSDCFDDLMCVRAFKFRGFGVALRYGELIHLRYLEIFRDAHLKELPDTVCDLYNMQTLKIIFCERFEKLPTGRQMGKLGKLRHLELWGNHGLAGFPKGIEMLKSHLQTLSLFVVGEEGYCKIGALGKWKQLQGILAIHGLGNVRERGEAERADLKSKVHLRHLVLDFHAREEKRVMDDGEIMQALQPPPFLETLHIRRYSTTNHSVLNNYFTPNLKKIVLFDLQNLECLPHSLCALPCLESLEIVGTDTLKKVGDEFLGVSSSSSTSTVSGSIAIAFPKLKHLTFDSMNDWEEWENYKDRDQAAATTITIMPSLSHLHIEDCSRLKALPQFLVGVPLKSLSIEDCDELEKRLTKETGEDWPIISGIPKLSITGKLVNYSW